MPWSRWKRSCLTSYLFLSSVGQLWRKGKSEHTPLAVSGLPRHPSWATSGSNNWRKLKYFLLFLYLTSQAIWSWWVLSKPTRPAATLYLLSGRPSTYTNSFIYPGPNTLSPTIHSILSLRSKNTISRIPTPWLKGGKGPLMVDMPSGIHSETFQKSS